MLHTKGKVGKKEHSVYCKAVLCNRIGHIRCYKVNCGIAESWATVEERN